MSDNANDCLQESSAQSSYWMRVGKATVWSPPTEHTHHYHPSRIQRRRRSRHSFGGWQNRRQWRKSLKWGASPTFLALQQPLSLCICAETGCLPSWRGNERSADHNCRHIRSRREGNGKTYALQSSFLPLGPFLHSGLVVALQLEHFNTPVGRLPPLRPPDSRAAPGLTLRLGGGTTSVAGEASSSGGDAYAYEGDRGR